jgi:hypothetical protein
LVSFSNIPPKRLDTALEVRDLREDRIGFDHVGLNLR